MDHSEAEVVEARLPDDFMGYYDPDRDRIVVDYRLTPRERRVVLAHEQVHARRRDWNCAPDGPDGPRIARRWERAADVEAARSLISPEALADALLWGWDDHELAEELHVDEETVRVRRAALTEVERAVITARLDEAERWIA